MPPSKKKREQMLDVARNCDGAIIKVAEKRFKIGAEVGRGEYGVVKLAAEITGSKVGAEDYVVKLGLRSEMLLERKGMQGMLLTESSSNVVEWKRKHKLSHLGVPRMVKAGTVDVDGQMLEAIFLPRLGPSLQEELEAGGLSEAAVADVWQATLEALQYIHSRGFVHNDVKPSNICRGRRSEETTLIDYGTADRYAEKPAVGSANAPAAEHHETYSPQPAVAAGPVGSLKYACSDAHAFVEKISRRGDLESLGYMVLNMLGSLPWGAEADWRAVGQQKAAAFPTAGGAAGLSKAAASKNAKVLVKKCHVSAGMSAVCEEYMAAVFQLNYNQEPDYSSRKKATPAKKTTPKVPPAKKKASTKKKKAPTKKAPAAKHTPQKKASRKRPGTAGGGGGGGGAKRKEIFSPREERLRRRHVHAVERMKRTKKDSA
eukprot:gene12680-33496_t